MICKIVKRNFHNKHVIFNQIEKDTLVNYRIKKHMYYNDCHNLSNIAFDEKQTFKSLTIA